MWRNGTPLDSRVVHGMTAPSSSCVWNLRVFPYDARGCQCPFVLCLHPQGCLRRGVRANPEPPSHLPPHTIPLGHTSAPAPSFLYPASNLDWRFVSYMILYMFQCHSPKSSHPLPLPQSPKDCSIHLCLSCCLAYRVIVTIFLIPYICVSILYWCFSGLLHSV